MPCLHCREDKKLVGRGLCRSCYYRQRARLNGPCSHCGKPDVVAVGLCGACYQRRRSNGTLQRKLMSNVGKTCSVDGCREPAVVKGVCHSHYGYTKHPLTNTWQLIKSRYGDSIPEGWQAFENFLKDVGERPTHRSQLRRVREDLPWSVDNIRWLEPIWKHTYSPEKMKEYHVAWRWRRIFGLTVEDYDRMLSEQNGVCAICGGKQDTNKKTGKPRNLGVDHCHTTMKVRGLLCVNCNRGLGYFSDDIERLRSAIAYLEKHAAKKAA